MKVSRIQSAKNRSGIVEAAARLYREKGLHGVGVAEITQEAGLTHGGLYRHFDSKDALAREACIRAFDWKITSQDAEQGANADARLQALVHDYLSTRHRDNPGDGCPVAALAMDAARAGPPMSEVFAEGIERNIQRFAQAASNGSHAAGATERADTIHMLASMVGAMVLARATAAANPALSEEILATLRQRLAAV
ncbi:TetR/AcrR family transcriptional regulator [Diaphorobacter aerolatus]|uniref:TetR/AcrR family transcriptional regulator n=1 Tax=Diaphorobacter aerolatus TaxID=1288495 RepID=A0A7H0GHF4_9BURK|nr:TetR/AcrR family transcriptional regulator [Diaphorobacter aerolatus]QNP47720.1 TetR/AcrR family transcriptional regulator [Diaphorobacter aerolatus]